MIACQIPRWQYPGWNDGVVVADLAVVEISSCIFEAIGFQSVAVFAITSHRAELVDRLCYGLMHVLRQVL